VRAPGAKQADNAAAADIDEVAREDVLMDVRGAAVAAKQREVRRLAARGVEGAVEAHDVVVGVAAGCRQETDARTLAIGKAEHVVVEERIALLHREATASKRDDLPPFPHVRSVGGRCAELFRPLVETRSTWGPSCRAVA